MLPVFLALTGTGLGSEGKLFIGRFSPCGLASIVYAVIVLEANLPNSDNLAVVVACTVILGILIHGVNANPWARACDRRSQQGSMTGSG
jgi:NhaP-type Na+/H+ or K+/H+ antiporter